MKNKILIFGKGYIGKRIKAELNAAISSRRINSLQDAEKEVSRYKPNIIINCIGHTGKHNVDDCEIDKDKTLFSNSFVPLILAEAAIRNKIKLVHISSGCIYHFNHKKQKPITEKRVPDFFNLYYSRSKIYAERALEALSSKFDILIVRIRIPLDNRPHPRNILTKLLTYKKVINIPNSITYIPDFINALKYLLRKNKRGIFNIVNKGGLRYPDLMSAYKKQVPSFNCKVIGYSKLGLVRTNLILSVKKLRDAGFNVRPVRKVLYECVRRYLE